MDRLLAGAPEPDIAEPPLRRLVEAIGGAVKVRDGVVAGRSAPTAVAHDPEPLPERGTRVRRSGVGLIPVGDPLGHVAGHVLHAVGALALGEAAHRSQPRAADVALFFIERVAPRVFSPVGSARRLFPLGLGRQSLPGPSAEPIGLEPRDTPYGPSPLIVPH